jgi:hypothetical protein
MVAEDRAITGGRMNNPNEESRPEIVAICVEFLSQCEMTKKPQNRGPLFLTTYGLKHILESWCDVYVNEFECVIALMETGFSLHWSGHGVTFTTNVCQKSVKRVLDKGKRS